MKQRLQRVYKTYKVEYRKDSPFMPMMRLVYLRARELGLMAVCLCIFGVVAHGQSCPAPTPGSPHICLKWTASTTNGVTYNLYRATASGAENYAAPLNTSPISGTSFYDTTAAIGTQYFYTALAVGTGGVLSAPTAEVSAQVPVPPNPPSAFGAAID